MGAKGMVSFIAIVALLFPLAATIISECYRKNGRQQLSLGKVSNLERTMDEETFTHSVKSLQDLDSSGINKAPLEKERFVLDCLKVESPIRVPIRRKLSEETPKFNGQILDIEPIPFAVSKADDDVAGITNTTIIIAVVSTSVVTFLLATLFFCWYTRAYSGVKNDEKPLLSLSTSSSQKPAYSVQKSNKVLGNGGDQLLSTKSDIKKTISSVNSSVSLGIPLDPPPGNLIASGIAPLKPPPGRPDLALKTPPGMNDLHTPPLHTASPPSLSPAGGGGSAAAPALSPSLLPSAAPFSLRGPSRAASARRPPLAAPPPPPPRKAPPPPPPLRQGPPPPPPVGGAKPPPRAGLKNSRRSPGEIDGDDANKAKLKPFFWDKVSANPDQAMAWHQIRAGSFQFNEEMIENLFGYSEKNKGGNKKSAQDPSSKLVQLIDGKKAQNLSILLKALNVTTNEVCDALKEGNELPLELIQTLLKMAPTGEEEMKLRLYDGDLSRLGTAEKFLKKLVEIPFAYKRLESLLFMCTLEEEQDSVKESFQILETACKELKKSRLFLKLLEAVLKTGNRMNDGTFRGSAQAFKLDTLLKLSDVKGMDGKTTLLHFVVVEIIRAEGIRAAKNDNLLEEATDEFYRNLGLQEVARLCGELEDVKKAAIIDSDSLTGTVSKYKHELEKAREFLDTDLKNLQENKKYNDDGDDDDDDDGDGDDDEFCEILSGFVASAEKDIMWMVEEEKRIMALVKKTADYFHGQTGKDEGLRLFVIVRDFLLILDKVCKEIKETPLKPPPKPVEKKEEAKDVSPRRTTDETKDDLTRRTREETKDVSPSGTIEKTKDVSPSATIEKTKDVSPLRMTEETKDGSPRRTTDETKDDLTRRTREETKDVSPSRTIEKTKDVSPSGTIEKTKDVSPRRMTEEETKDGSPHRTTEETKDGSPRGTTEETKDGSPRRITEEKKDNGSPHRTTEETKDGSPHGMTEETKNVLSPRTWESDDLPCQTGESGDVERNGLQDPWKFEGTGDEARESEGPREGDGLQESWEKEDDGDETWESESSQEVDNLQESWKNDDPEHEIRESGGPEEVDDLQDSWDDEDPGHETQESENPTHEVEENYDLHHETWETKSPNKIEENDDLGHETLEHDDDDSQPKTHKDEDLDVKTHEHDNSQHKTHDHDDFDDDDDDSQPKIHDDQDLEVKTHEPHNSQHMTHDHDDFDDYDDDSQPKTHDDQDLEVKTHEPRNSQHMTHDHDDFDFDDDFDDDDSQPKTPEVNTHEPDNSHYKTHDDDDDSQHKTHDDDDDSQAKTHEDEDLMVKRHEPDNVQHKTLEDDDMEPNTLESEDLQNGTREDDDLQNDTRKSDDMQNETRKNDDLQNETRDIDDLQNETRDIDDLHNGTREDDGSQKETRENDDLQNETPEIDDSRPSEPQKSGFRVPNERLIPAIALRRVDTFDSDENSTSDDD